MKNVESQGNIFLKMHPLHRILASFFLGLGAFLAVGGRLENGYLRIVIGWDVFAFIYCLTSWIVFFQRETAQIKRLANLEDGSRGYVILVLLTACFASLLMVLLLMLSKPGEEESQLLYSLAAVFGMMFSWAMVHTTFGFHYANMFYNYDDSGKKQHVGGLEFPGDKNPDYLDFAYFSFVIGMTFQVSDVQITNRVIRRTVLLHGLISFMLNTFVVALTINLIAGLKK
jgi:uncharacterized membrane protein